MPWPVVATPTPVPPPLSLLGPAASDAANAVVAEAVAAFEASSNVKVAGMLVPDYAETLQTRLADGTPPDVFVAWSHQLGDLVADGHLAAIPPAYAGAMALPPNLAGAVQVEGTTYCVPRDATTLALYYNPAVFDRGEAAYPTVGWAWQDLAAAAEATTDANFGYYGLVMQPEMSRLHPFLLQAATDADLWGGSDAATAVEFFAELFDDGWAVEPLRLDSSWAGEAFGRGRAAMTIEGPWLIDYLAAEFPALDYEIVELPTGPAGRGTTAFVSCWVIGAQAGDPAAALALIAELSAPNRGVSLASGLGSLPPSLEQATALLGTQPRLAPFVAGLAYAAPWTGPAGFTAQAEAANTALRMWLDDEATTADLLERVASLAGSAPAP
jgi:multiple sugar transport system substrate-binding protein